MPMHRACATSSARCTATVASNRRARRRRPDASTPPLARGRRRSLAIAAAAIGVWCVPARRARSGGSGTKALPQLAAIVDRIQGLAGGPRELGRVRPGAEDRGGSVRTIRCSSGCGRSSRARSRSRRTRPAPPFTRTLLRRPRRAADRARNDAAVARALSARIHAAASRSCRASARLDDVIWNFELVGDAWSYTPRSRRARSTTRWRLVPAGSFVALHSRASSTCPRRR